jgi:hypothetical protein
MMEKAEQ